jgi:transcription antitermination factor NusA-like protein
MSLVNEALQRPSLAPKTPDAPAASEVSHMLPEAIAAKVIGPGGSNVRRVREATGAKIKIGNDRTGEPGQLYQELHLSGSEEQVAAALAMINEIIANDAGPDKGSSPRNGEQTVTCHVPLGVAGRIIGPKGATVKTIREQSGAKIKIHNTTGPSATSQAVDITGSEQGCRIAYAMVMEIASAPASTGSGPRQHNGRSSGGHTSHRGPPPPVLAPPPQTYQPPPQPYAYPMPAPAHYGYDASGYGAPQPTAAYGPPPGYGAPPPQAHYGAPQAQQHAYGPPQPHPYHQQPPPSAYAPPRPMHGSQMPNMQPQAMFGQPRPAAPRQAGYGPPEGGAENGGYAAGLQAGMAAILQGNLPPELAAMFAQHQGNMQHGAPTHAVMPQHEPLV